MTTERDPLLQAEIIKSPVREIHSVNSPDNSEETVQPGSVVIKRHWKNVFVLCLAWLFNFTAVASFQNLQSSLNPQGGLGVISVAALYVGSIISSFYAPLVVKFLGLKWTIVVCMSCYGVYTATNFYPQFYTLVPSGTLIGLASNPMWTSEGTYIATSAMNYGSLTGLSQEVVINRFNGVFYFFFQSAQISGNLIASLILYPNTTGMLPDVNLTHYCGVHSCGPYVDPAGAPPRPEQSTLNTLFFVFLGCNAIGVLLVLLFLDRPIKNAGSSSQSESICQKITASLRLVIKDRRMLLFYPLLIYSGVQKGFIADDFTKAFVSCTQGIHYVGFVMMAYGITDALSSLLLTRIQRYVGRVALFTAGAVADFAFVFLMWFLWPPSRENLWALFLAAGVWGFGDSVWQTQIASLLGVTFVDNLPPAYANFRLCQAVGNGVMFAVSTSSAVCVYHKMIALTTLLSLSLVSYYALEILLKRRNKKRVE